MKTKKQIWASFLAFLEEPAKDVKFYDEGKDGLAIQINYKNTDYRIIASWGMHWEHVSMSLKDRIPYWEEMCWLKDLFWNNNETVIQYHPAKENYINNHQFCLHLWKPQRHTIPLPPIEMIGFKSGNK